jgi:hypothetical protein
MRKALPSPSPALAPVRSDGAHRCQPDAVELPQVCVASRVFIIWMRFPSSRASNCRAFACYCRRLIDPDLSFAR